QVRVELDGQTLLRELRAGEGFAAQNSATMVIGIGEREAARAVTVRWPAGSAQTLRDVPSGSLLVVYENPAQSPTGQPFGREPYERPAAAAVKTDAARPRPRRRFP